MEWINQLLANSGIQGGLAGVVAALLALAVKAGWDWFVDRAAKSSDTWDDLVVATAREVAARLTDPNDKTTPTLEGVTVKPPAE